MTQPGQRQNTNSCINALRTTTRLFNWPNWCGIVYSMFLWLHRDISSCIFSPKYYNMCLNEMCPISSPAKQCRYQLNRGVRDPLMSFFPVFSFFELGATTKVAVFRSFAIGLSGKSIDTSQSTRRWQHCEVHARFFTGTPQLPAHRRCTRAGLTNKRC